jgi:drug/metabolite transporter (DMT)-like permease
MRAAMADHAATLPRSTWALLAILTLGWGMNWPMIKMAVADIPIWTFRAECLAVGALGMFAIARATGLPIAVPRPLWPRLALVSLFNVTLWNVLVTYGVRSLPSGRSAILAYTMPLWTVLLSAAILHEPLSRRRITGVALGMGGLALLLGRELLALESAPVGAMVILAAALCWAAGTTLMKKYPTGLPTTVFTGWNFVIGGIPLVIGAVVFEHDEWRPVGTAALVGLVYNMIVAFIVCHWIWFRIVQIAPAGVSALGTLMIPVVAVFSGMLILGERPGWSDLSALALILAALATVLIPPRRTSG